MTEIKNETTLTSTNTSNATGETNSIPNKSSSYGDFLDKISTSTTAKMRPILEGYSHNEQ